MAKTKHFNLIDVLSKIAKTAEKYNWIKSYDKQLDYFCWTKPSISKDVRLVKISREALLYLNQEGGIEGIGVEYLKSNFIQHNPDYKDLPKLFTEEIEEGVFIIPKEREKLVADRFGRFTEDLKDDIYEENWQHNQTPKDLERLIGVAIRS